MPGTHCLHMCLIAMTFLGFRISLYSTTLYIVDVTSLLHNRPARPNMAGHTCTLLQWLVWSSTVSWLGRSGLQDNILYSHHLPPWLMDNSDNALLYALERLSRPLLKLKTKQMQAIYKLRIHSCMWLPTGFGKSICFEAIPFTFDDKLG